MPTLATPPVARVFAALRRVLPEGKELPEDEWSARHKAILIVVFGHAVGVGVFGLFMGAGVGPSLAEGGLVAFIGVVAAWEGTKRRFRAAVAALALVTSSAIIVQFSGGYIEAHFHFFVVLAVISLYQDWVPFLLAILYVAVDHGVVGALFPALVYNHPDAFAHPWKWALIHAALVLGESVALLMGWKVAETARRRTALVLDSAGDGIIGMDLDGVVTFANPAAAKMMGREVGEILGKPVAGFLQADAATAEPDHPWLPRPVAGAVSHVVRKDGALVPIESDRTPIRNNDAIVGTVMTIKDVTERRRAEDALRRAVSTLTATLESTTDGILVIDQSGKIAGYNKKFLEMWNIPVSVMSSGEDSRALAFVQDQLVEPGSFTRRVRELYAQPEATSFDVLEFRDGRTFERYSQPQRVGTEVVGRVWSFRDVTERRRAEAALRDQQLLQAAHDRLREMDTLKTQFINNAAHELGTPLTPIKLQAYMLAGGKLGPLSEKQMTSVRVLSRNVDRLGFLLRDVMDSARVQAGKLDVHSATVDLNLLVQEAVESFVDPAAADGVELVFEPRGQATITADGARLTQVLFNLIRNALKFTPKGGRVSLHVSANEREAVIEVKDTGTGIRAEDITKLFQPFSQVHDVMQNTRSGTGLGLYISKGIVESHGGTIECESAGPGKGTTFRVKLPRVSA